MPVKTLIVPENGGQIERPPDLLEQDTNYFYDYTGGRERIIGIECPVYDFGATIYLEDNPDVVRSFVEGDIAPEELFGIGNELLWLMAQQSIDLPIWNREGKCARLLIQHVLQDPSILN